MGQYTMDANTVALLHFEDGFKDESGRIWTANGSLTTSTADHKFGSGAVYFDGTTTEKNISTPITSALQLGSSPFTAEFWIKPAADMGSQAILLGSIPGYRVDGGWMIFLNSNGCLGFYRGKQNVDDMVVTSVGAVSLGSWSHVAVVRETANSANIKIYINGVKKADGNVSNATIIDSTVPLRLGRGYETWSTQYVYKGYIDEVRISNVARWTSDFTPEEPSTTPAPMNLTVVAGDKKVTLSWNAVAGANGYNVKRSTTAGGPYTTIASNITGTSYVDATVVNGTTYYYVVTAIGANGESANSNEASATPQGNNGQGLIRITLTDSS